MKIAFYILGLFLIVTAIVVTFFSPSPDLISPMGTASILGSNATTKKYVIFGFAPYWNLKKLSPESLENITHFAYFNLLLNSDGTIYSRVNRREEDPSYTNYKRLLSGTINRGNKPLIITFMPESQAALTSIISSKMTRAKTIETIGKIVTESNASGINIDFEPLGETSQVQRDNFTAFITELKDTIPTKQLSISVYASSAVKPRIWDLKALDTSTDYFVVMTYDYTMPTSNISGPNSPLRGSGDILEHDIIKNIAEITKLTPSNKILLGVPFYGYEWDTIDSSKYSPAQGRGSLASLERVQEMIDNKTLDLLWDRNSLTPYGISTDSGQVSQIYFENETSIRLKIEFVKSANLGGIAIWALGYEGNSNWIWPTITKLNR